MKLIGSIDTDNINFSIVKQILIIRAVVVEIKFFGTLSAQGFIPVAYFL
ncbi:MAG: hypothetical protein WC542_00735 [Paludibacter sp.]